MLTTMKASARVASETPTEFRRSVTRMARLLGTSMPKGELTPMKLSALGILRRGGPMSASALASQLGILRQSLTRILADLEAEGLLTRSRDGDDGREHVLQPTPKALTLMRAEGVRRDAAMREAMLQVLTPVEIGLLLLAAKTMNKLADGWSTALAESSMTNEETSK
jgi:DNA-binding MarR family transcriptional regulator